MKSRDQKRFAKSVLVVLAFVASLAGWNSPNSSSATPATNPYPYPRSTYWAWQNRPDLPVNLGEAAAWNDNAQAQGWPVGPYPRRGDVAVFEANVYGAPPSGHVAIVEQVLEDGSFVSSQMDDTDCHF